MSAAWDPGLIVEALIDVLQAHMPAKLTALNTAYADDITLACIDKWYRARLGQYDAYPLQVVAPVGQPLIYDQDGGFGIWKHPIEIVTHLVSTNESPTVSGDPLLPPEAMQVRLGRYLRATTEVLNEHRSLVVPGGAAKIVAIGPATWEDYEYNVGNPALMRRSFVLPVEVAAK